MITPTAPPPGRSYPAATRLLALLLPLAFVGIVAWWSTHPLHRDSVAPQPTRLRINVNAADAATLALLPGIGPGVAQRIIDHREKHGRFRTASDLEQVELIGPTTIEKIAPWVVFEADAEGKATSEASFRGASP